MKQFDVVSNPFPRSRERQPFLVVLQTDLLLRNLETTIVAPLESMRGLRVVDRLNPTIQIEDKRFALILQELVSVKRSVLGPVRGSIANQRDIVIAALDLLFTGF